MNADQLGMLVHRFFRDRAADYALDPHSLAVEYVLNWGGFVNHSYRVHDARTAYHVKLSAHADRRETLAQWHALTTLLERHRAPPVLAWIDVGPAAGLLFPHVQGTTPALDDILDDIVPVLAALHADRELAAMLPPAPTSTARDAYLGTFHDRFTEDLRTIREVQPAIVPTGVREWMEHEAASLARDVARTDAFSEPLTCAVHGDLWLNNILRAGADNWHVLDWDDMCIGDPMTDFAALLGPTAQDLHPLKMLDRISGTLSNAQHDRLQLLGRATLLDWVIDSVADWIDADTAPAHADVVHTEKERIHLSALALYTELYG